MSNQKFFRLPWGTSGDRDVIPDATQADGSVSYNQGFGFDYERDPATDPEAKNIQRETFNGVMYDLTQNVRQYQLFGVPEWVTAAQNGGTSVAYSRYARVRYDTAGDGSNWLVYESAVDANTSTPGSDNNWTVVSNSTYYGADTGSANTYQVAYVPAVTALRDGLTLGFTAKTANTGDSTFAPNGVAAKQLVGAAQLALQGGEILANSRCQVRYSSTLDKWILVFASGGAQQVADGVRSQHASSVVQQQNNSLRYAPDTGVANAYVCNLVPAVTALVDGMVVTTRPKNANTLPGPTLRVNGTGTKAIRKSGGVALSAGDIGTGGYECQFQYSSADDYWVLLNPANGVATLVSGSPTNDSSARPVSSGWLRGAMAQIASAAGFSFVGGINGYVQFPSWLGGILFQWGQVNAYNLSTVTVTYPKAFPNSFMGMVQSTYNDTAGSIDAARRTSSATPLTTMTFRITNADGGTAVQWWAFGF